MITQKQLNKMVCQEKNCKHTHEELVIHSVCHFKTPTIALFDDNILRIHCAECEKLILSASIDGLTETKNLFVNENGEFLMIHGKCHKHHLTFSWYDSKTGNFTVKCADCDKLICSIHAVED